MTSLALDISGKETRDVACHDLLTNPLNLPLPRSSQEMSIDKLACCWSWKRYEARHTCISRYIWSSPNEMHQCRLPSFGRSTTLFRLEARMGRCQVPPRAAFTGEEGVRKSQECCLFWKRSCCGLSEELMGRVRGRLINKVLVSGGGY